ncbi:lipoprotein insertase outer membrane protein LolB [Gayadomonas joobiniege]|uniref:lipoprotein insertase outer membrane protein LolB n=1 Tax=Gayadomonas joobiniege TaxID=1234606 RepID=UPI00037A090A|nr:lipoprotein insertase outer membrane protein LolB [Gayadomonas joobiniege]
MKAFHIPIRTLILLIAVFLSACSSLPDSSNDTQITDIRQINQFHLTGKIAFINPQKRHSANLYWRQVQNNYDIRLTTLLGISLAKIEGGRQQIKIQADGETYQSNAPNRLVENVIGWPIPVDQLANWVLGRHQGVVMSVDQDKRAKKVLVRINADEEWMLTYHDYKKIGNIELPGRIECERYQNRLILKINQWSELSQ